LSDNVPEGNKLVDTAEDISWLDSRPVSAASKLYEELAYKIKCYCFLQGDPL